MGPRLLEIAGLVAGERETAAGDAGFHDPTRVLRFFQEARLERPRRPQFAAQEGQGPLKVRRRKAVRKVVGLGRELLAREKAASFPRRRTPWPTSSPGRRPFADQPPPASLRGLDLVRLRQRRQQRLRLRDLGHFRRRRKAFERRREDGVGFGGAAGRLIELGERERRAQFEAARALPLRDGDGRLESFFRGRGVRGIALQQHFAPGPIKLRVERAMTEAVGRRQRFVEDREGAVEIAGLSFGFGQGDLDGPVEAQGVLLRAEVSAPRRISSSPSPGAPLQRSPSPRERPRTLSTTADHARATRRASLGRVQRRAAKSPRISSNMAACHFPRKRVRADVRGLDKVARRVRSNQGNRAPRSFPGAISECQVEHCRDPGVLAEAKRPDRRPGRVGTE